MIDLLIFFFFLTNNGTEKGSFNEDFFYEIKTGETKMFPLEEFWTEHIDRWECFVLFLIFNAKSNISIYFFNNLGIIATSGSLCQL